jgi:hypothetical protein
VINYWVRNRELEAELKQAAHAESAGPENPTKSGAEGREASQDFAGNPLLVRFLRENPVNGVAVGEALERFSSGEGYVDSLRSYIVHTPALLEKIRSPDAVHLDDYRINVHGIKGSSFGISANDLGRKAEELEKAAKAGDILYIRRYNEGFINHGKALLGDLNKLLDKAEAKFTKPQRAAPDKAVLDRIYRAAGEYNIGELDRAMEELEQYSYEANADLILWLREQIDASEFEQIRERLSKL